MRPHEIPYFQESLTLFLGAVAVEPIDWSKGTAAMTIFQGLKNKMAPDATHESPVDFLMVVGDGRDDEVIFRWANELGKDAMVKNVTTVSLGSRNTEAMTTLTQGVTGKLRILHREGLISDIF